MATRTTRALLVVAALAGATACFPPDDGRPPKLARLYFPVGVAINPDATRLYVVNSDFDLQFNAGSVQAFDLDALRSLIPAVDAQDPCASLGGEKAPALRFLAPGRCKPVDPERPPRGVSLLAGKVEIGAFATDIVYSKRPSEAAPGPRGRLFIPVRGDDTLHWIDVDDPSAPEAFECGQGADGACDDNHRRGDDAVQENTRELRLPPEPFGIAADERGEALLMTHQSDGKVSLFINRWDAGASGGPRLAFVLGDDLPSGALAVASIPEPRLVAENRADYSFQPSFLMTFRNAAQVRLVRYFDDREASPSRPFLEARSAVAITTNSGGWESRGVAIDAGEREACEAPCVAQAEADRAACADAACTDAVDAAKDACLVGCVDLPLDVYVANRAPASLIVGQTRPNGTQFSGDDLPRFFDALPLSFGASRVVVGNVRDVVEGKTVLVRRIFIVCFDSRQIFIYDPAARRFEKVIHTGRGPHAFAVDVDGDPATNHRFGYVAHFTDSYLGVVDLDRSHTATYGEFVLTVGEPTEPRASK